MLKRILIVSTVFAFSASLAFANGSPYFGASISEVTYTNDTQNSNFRGTPFSINLGYGGLLSQNLYLGGELFGTLGTATLNDNGLKTTYGYGASLLPGIMLSDHTMTYARAGVVRTRFTPSSAPNHNVNGGQLGLGMQIGLSQNLDIRGEYIYTAYQSFSRISAPRQDQFALGLAYKFD